MLPKLALSSKFSVIQLPITNDSFHGKKGHNAMKPDALTPNTLLVGLYVQDGKAVALGSINSMTVEPVTVQGENLIQALPDGTLPDVVYNVRPDVLQAAGGAWEALAGALAEATIIDTDHVVILTNDGDVVKALTRFTLPAAATTIQVKTTWDPIKKRQDTVTIKTGWDPHHTAVLQHLGMRGGKWRVVKVDDLPMARKEWTNRWQ
jgi:hypothetical protein